MPEDLIATLRQLIVHELYVEIPEEKIGVDDGLRAVIGLDSVGFAELRVLCEQRFNVLINDEDYTPDNFGTLRRLAALIDRLQAGRRSGGAQADASGPQTTGT